MLYARPTRWLSTPRLARRMALVVLVASLPSLATPLACDDFGIAARVEHDPLSAYAFTPPDHEAARTLILAERSRGIAPWWVGEQLRASFFRPLTSASLWLDFAHAAPTWWMHLENCAIYALTIALAVLVYRRLGLSGAGLGWAAAFLGLDGAYSVSVAWIAARNTLMACLFGVACLLAHDRARRDGRPVFLLLSCACFALSLLGAELGLATLGYVCAYTVTIDRAPLPRRALAITPHLGIACAYLALYVTGGYGAHWVGAYRDPISAPGAALLAFLETLPIWLGSAATLPYAGLYPILTGLRVPLLVFSLVALVVIGRLVWTRADGARAGDAALVRFFVLGAVLSLVPLVSVAPMERIRFLLSFGVCGVLGPWVARDFDAPGRGRRWTTRVVWLAHGVALPLLFVPSLFSTTTVDGAARALDAALPSSTATAIAINPPIYASVQWLSEMRAHRGQTPPAIFGLYAGAEPLEVERTDERTLELRVAPSWCPTAIERVRDFSEAPLRPGDRVHVDAFDVEVREVDEGGVPTRARFTFARSLDDTSVSFWAWDGARVTAWTPPPVGGRVAVAAASMF